MSTKLDPKIGAIIGIGIFAGLASAFGYFQYQQTSSLEQEKSTLWAKIGELNSSVKEWKAAHHEKELLIEDLIDEKNTLYSDKGELESKVNQLSREKSKLQNDLTIVKNELTTVKNNYNNLQAEYSDLTGQYYEVQTEKEQLQQEKYQQEVEEYEFILQTREITFYRALTVRNYKDTFLGFGGFHSFSISLPASQYFDYRKDVSTHIPAIATTDPAGQAQMNLYATKTLETYNDVRFLANYLRGISGSDDELYANLVLQVVHQLKYIVTTYTKYPSESLVEGSGDCDTLATLAVALLKAGGLDAILIYGKAYGSPETNAGVYHAMAAVALNEEPDDHNRQFWSYTYNDARYYIMEATWSSNIAVWDYSAKGSAVGDFPWNDMEIYQAIKA